MDEQRETKPRKRDRRRDREAPPTGEARVQRTSGQLRVQRQRRDGLTKARLQTFLDHLAATCNVRASAEAAGVASTSLFRRRNVDPSFAALWEQALEVGSARLEALLLQHALTGSDLDGIEPDPERADVAFNPKLAMAVLASRDARLKRAGRGPQVALMPIDEVERILMKRFAALGRRQAQEAAAKGETA